jgi:Tol biopolymer transport system component
VRGSDKALARIQWPKNDDFGLTVSPDGRLIVVKSESRREIRILDWRNGTARFIKYPPAWRIVGGTFAPDGKALIWSAFTETSSMLVCMDLDGRTHVLLERDRLQWLNPAWPSPNGRFLAFDQRADEGNVWLLENF